MTDQPEPSRHQEISAVAQQMLALGESGRYEFKRNVEAVTVGLLAALANWVAAEPDREVAHLLVGVDEVEDKTTGLVHGQPFGLPRGLDKAVSRIQDVASKTRPVPVEVFIVEEGVAEPTPFVRVEVRPTMPPHFDDQGRRQTRQGRSTRALTDEELLRIYLDREAGSFAMRFRQVSDELRSAVGAVGSQVDQIAEGIENNVATPILALTRTTQDAADAAESASSSADSAASSADTVSYEVEHVQRIVRELQRVVEDIQDDSTQNLAYRVMRLRRKVWWNFTVDTWEHKSKRADQLEARLRELLSGEVSLEADRNTWELRVWQDLLKDRRAQRGERGTQKWWDAAIREVISFMESPAYAAPDLPELRAALKADLDHEIDHPDSVTNLFRRLLGDS
ncbi:AlbA family DNA-binding domain-containing protein [Microbacterium aurum]